MSDLETTTSRRTGDGTSMLSPSSSLRLRSKRLRRCLHLLHNKDNLNPSQSTDTDDSSIQSKHCSYSSTNQSKRRAGTHEAASAGGASTTTASGDSSFSSTGIADDEELDSNAEHAIAHATSPTAILSDVRSLSDSEVLLDMPRRRLSDSVASLASSYSSSCSDSDSSRYSTKRKGVKYSRDGAVVCCRFCDILRARDEDFLYEDDLISVFRPLAPVVASHILVVPRRHIRNVNMLTADHFELLSRMKAVAALVLEQLQVPPSSLTNTYEMPPVASLMPMRHSRSPRHSHTSKSGTDGSATQLDADYKFAFHAPPFNSIDHVHMHAFRRNEGSFGCFGSIKYCTETWWCRSFEQVINRLANDSAKHRSQHRSQQRQRHRRHHLGSSCMAPDDAVCVSS